MADWGASPAVVPGGCGVPGGASLHGYPTGVTLKFGWGSLDSCSTKAATWIDVPGFESVPARMFRGKQEGKDIRPILIMTFEALPNYIVSLKTTTQIFMSGTFYSHCNQ